MSASALKTAEDSVVTMIGTAFSGAVEPAVSPVAEEEVEHFPFDEDFQTKIAALTSRSNDFMRHVSHLIKPDYFDNVGEATLVNLVKDHFDRYGELPDRPTLNLAIMRKIEAKIIRKQDYDLLKAARARVDAADITNAEFVEEEIVRFVRYQALGSAILKSVNLREQGKLNDVERLVKEAIQIGKGEDSDAYDYFGRIKERTDDRLDKVSGKTVPRGITTGIPKMDELLYHKGWGRKELTTIMGGAKAGKTTALINFAKAAAVTGKNVLYATLEVSASIISDRLDACLSDTVMADLCNKIHGVHERIEEVAAKSGKLIVHEYASGTLTPSALKALIERYKSPGRNRDGSVRPPIVFDLVVVDYADIMAPDNRTQDAIENSKSVYVDLRAIAFEHNVAMLTATQTNREGYKAAVAKAEHVAEDFNKVRTVDLMISINKTEEEARRNEARLYFAASRNQQAGFTIFIKQNLEMMKFVESVLKVE